MPAGLVARRGFATDAKWELGFAQARIPDIHAWARLFALFALALPAVVSLAMKLLGQAGLWLVGGRQRS